MLCEYAFSCEAFISKLDDYTKDDQERKILEMSEVIEEMSWEELKAVLTIEMLDRIDEMLEEKKLSVENAVCLMKKIGYSKVVKNLWNNSFNDSLLRFRLEKLMLDEEKKMREMNEQFLVEVCECYILLRSNFISQKLLPGCTCSLLKAAMNKEESEGAQKEVEMALLALSNICVHQPMAQELFMYEILEIIEYHQEHHNLTRLGYQSAWGFLISRLYTERSLETVITYKLNFAREVVRELEELSKHIDWKKKEEERRGKVREEAYIFVRWILTLNSYFCGCEAWNGGLAGIVRSIVGAFREAKDNYREISDRCIFLFERIANMQAVQIDELLSGGAVDVVVEETVKDCAEG
eukprot:MONOS_8075.2-p1 / transcript=MONOS_8075.2 / gene=MONOS_8075 / organism=Monocercomonoides_exilis_PA203 / gene_product=unspecified product / transcript_product=unspecified product / location=Mono_scaffold00295:4075-5239(+) / protein_length=352 / sequence_SO=supercontig / SO=protein_coding / is_pseudo=false